MSNMLSEEEVQEDVGSEMRESSTSGLSDGLLTSTHPTEDDVELDYEAEEDEGEMLPTEEEMEEADTLPVPVEEKEDGENEEDEEEAGELPDGELPVLPAAETEKTLDSGEELEEGEVSDEDEESRKERLKPQPICRFYSKGQCTWGASCRFKHPGVLDKGNYSMFLRPKPILPGAENLDEKSPGSGAGVLVEGSVVSPLKPPPVPKVETAWERGLRQAKEMRKLSLQRKETDAEYEEKRTTMSLTQAELDKENDYYARQASPLHEDSFSDFEDPYEPPPMQTMSRRVAPPPPDDFYHYEGPSSREGGIGRRLGQRYQPPGPPDARHVSRGGGRFSPPAQAHPQSLAPVGRIARRVAPPRTPPEEQQGDRRRGGRGDEWADPWMRGGKNESQAGGRRRKSYSSGSSRSTSHSSTSRSRSRTKERKKRRSSSESSRSSHSGTSASRSRSHSSSPNDIPRRRRQSKATSPSASAARRPPPTAGLASKGLPSATAPLQKRLHGLATVPLRQIKKEPEDRPSKRRRRSSSASSKSSRSPSPPSKRKNLVPGRIGANPNKPVVPPVVSMDEPHGGSQSALSRPTNMLTPMARTSGLQSRLLPNTSQPPAKQQIKLTLKSSMSTKPANKTVLEKLGMSNEDIAETSSSSKKRKANEVFLTEIKQEKVKKGADKKDREKKKEKKTAADRREELLKQLKAVENAIAKKRTKMDD